MTLCLSTTYVKTCEIVAAHCVFLRVDGWGVKEGTIFRFTLARGVWFTWGFGAHCHYNIVFRDNTAGGREAVTSKSLEYKYNA